jgi:hypothetical protein
MCQFELKKLNDHEKPTATRAEEFLEEHDGGTPRTDHATGSVVGSWDCSKSKPGFFHQDSANKGTTLSMRTSNITRCADNPDSKINKRQFLVLD